MHARLRERWADAQQAFRDFGRHRDDALGAAIAFQTLLAIAPLLVIAVAVLGFVVGEGEARAEVLRTASAALGPKGAVIVGEWLTAARETGSSATAVGTILFLYGASRLVSGLDLALAVVFEEPVLTSPPMPRLQKFLLELRDRGSAVLLALFLGAWIAASIVGRRALAALWVPGPIAVVIHAALTLLSLLLALSVCYRYLPARRMPWRDALTGGAITAVLLTLGSVLLELWFTSADVGAGYGATGGIVAVLLWLYTSAQIFLFGAELSAARLRRLHPDATAAAATPLGSGVPAPRTPAPPAAIAARRS